MYIFSDMRANDEIVSQFVIKLSKSLPALDYCLSTAHTEQSHAISTTCQQNTTTSTSNVAPPSSSPKVCFPCDNCGNVYNYKTSLARHVRFECGKDPQFQCPFCEHRTKHKSSLTTHIDCKHKQELLYDENRCWREYYALTKT